MLGLSRQYGASGGREGGGAVRERLYGQNGVCNYVFEPIARDSDERAASPSEPTDVAHSELSDAARIHLIWEENITASIRSRRNSETRPSGTSSARARGFHNSVCVDQQSLFWLRTAFGDEAPCKTTTYDCFSEFKRDRVNLRDEFRDGRPSTIVKNKHRCRAQYDQSRQACDLL
ncbi:hypothetical protein EVAR_25284_1 [Eumeta japonica]|uniref:Uncharacterized protein n=1 Tax=Eumeta variegata TaxID=151549 RepID=A0A4C1VPV0_EUMVA|nr:hypothetical protein EVAR_25284_1 [Eumeta japonica]